MFASHSENCAFHFQVRNKQNEKQSDAGKAVACLEGSFGAEGPFPLQKKCVKSVHSGTFWMISVTQNPSPSTNTQPTTENDLGHASTKVGHIIYKRIFSDSNNKVS